MESGCHLAVNQTTMNARQKLALVGLVHSQWTARRMRNYQLALGQYVLHSNSHPHKPPQGFCFQARIVCTFYVCFFEAVLRLLLSDVLSRDFYCNFFSAFAVTIMSFLDTLIIVLFYFTNTNTLFQILSVPCAKKRQNLLCIFSATVTCSFKLFGLYLMRYSNLRNLQWSSLS